MKKSSKTSPENAAVSNDTRNTIHRYFSIDREMTITEQVAITMIFNQNVLLPQKIDAMLTVMNANEIRHAAFLPFIEFRPRDMQWGLKTEMDVRSLDYAQRIAVSLAKINACIEAIVPNAHVIGGTCIDYEPCGPGGLIAFNVFRDDNGSTVIVREVIHPWIAL